MTRISPAASSATLQLQKRREPQPSAKFQSFQSSRRGRASTNRRPALRAFHRRSQGPGNHTRDLSVGDGIPGSLAAANGLKSRARRHSTLAFSARIQAGGGRSARQSACSATVSE